MNKQLKELQELEDERKAHLKSMICKNFCKFPDQYSEIYGESAQDMMWNEVCDVCPLTEL